MPGFIMDYYGVGNTAPGYGGLDANTKLLLHMNAAPTDANTYLPFDGADASTTMTDSTGNHTWTASGDAQLDTAQKKWGSASLLLDGTGDYVSAPDSTDWDILGSTSGSFTISGFVRFAAQTGDPTLAAQFVDTSNAWQFRSNAGQLSLYAVNGGTTEVNISGGTLSNSTWHHCAACVVDGVVGLYIDGSQVAYDGSWSAFTLASSLYVGSKDGSASFVNGHIDDMAILPNNYFGAAPNVGNTDTITVPTSALGGFVDSSASAHSVTANGDAAISTARSKSGGASGLFDGTGDELSITDTLTDFSFGSGSFCIDTWAYLDETQGTTYNVFATYSGGATAWNGSDGLEWFFQIDQASADIFFQWSTGGSGNSSVSTSTDIGGGWHHVCACGNGTTIYLFVDGVLEDSAAGTITAISTPASLLVGNDPADGRSWVGNLDELRISKDSARIDDPNDPLYISSGTPGDGFTPPTQEYEER